MRIVLSLLLIFLALSPAAATPSAAATPAPARVTVRFDEPGVRVSPNLFGIFYEEINCSGDGGLYPELVRNRSFEDAATPENWALVTTGLARGTMAMVEGWPVGAFNRRGLRLTALPGAAGRVAITNDGWWGMAVSAGREYALSFNARADNGFRGPITATLECSGCERPFAAAQIVPMGSGWRRYSVTLRSSATNPRARLALGIAKPGSVVFDFVSLVPRVSWKGHGLRPDLARMLDALKPGFVRFPGGCWVEGERMELAQRWKTTIGDPALRRTQYNIWQYMATNGLGYHEYLQLCEDLGAPALFVINCGMSHQENVPMDRMAPWVQDALDAIEYAIGPAASKWGSLRARAGHPRPFNLRYLEIGNENGGPAYNERYALFYDAVRARYPQIRLVANVPVTSRPMDIVDEHYYMTPEWFMANAGKYDSYDRKGPRIFVGEYAVTQGAGQGNLRAAVGEAAFMTGLERNGDVVELASYAPLFVNVNHKRWNPDLIDFDSSRAFGIPSYYVQQMFARNRVDTTVPTAIDQPNASVARPTGAVGVGTWLTRAEFKDLVVSRGDRVLWRSDFGGGTPGWRFLAGEWKVEDGALRQSDLGTDRRAVVGDPTWDEYTFSLKARKIDGSEGFLILFHAQDGSHTWWNLGGWGNSQHGLELGGIVDQKPGRIEAERWYDIRVEVHGGRIRCFLDGRKVHDVAYPSPQPLYAVAGRIGASRELVVKLVNAASVAVDASLDLLGARRLGREALVTTLSSRNALDENTLAEPQKVAPKVRRVPVAAPRLKLRLPAWSVSVVRMRGE